MDSRKRLGAPSRRSELLALVLGVASGLVMLLAAVEIRSRPEWTGKLALDDAARELAQKVYEEWTEMLRSPAFGVRTSWRPGGQIWITERRTPDGEARLVPGVEVDARRLRLLRAASRTEASEEPLDPDSLAAFDALLVETRYQEVERHDLERAVGAITSALAYDGIDAARRARGRLLAVQLGLRAKREDFVREQWAAAEAETKAVEDLHAAAGKSAGISCALLTGLAVAAVLDGEEHVALGEELAEWWRTGRVGMDDGATLVRGAGGVLETRLEPGLRVLLDEVTSLFGAETDRAAVLVGTVAARARLGAYVRWLEEGGAAEEVLLDPSYAWRGDLVRDERGEIGSLARGDDLLIVRPRGELAHCFFHRVSSLRADLRERLDRLASFGRGFHVDLTGEETELGEEVGPWNGLAGGKLGFVLRHDNPAGFIDSEERRLGRLQVGLVVMGLFTLLAGVVSFGGLRRQRRLQELKAGFIARVSHELRTPVTGILLATERLVDGPAGAPERVERYHGLIRKEARRLERLVANVLDFSRLDRGEGPRLERVPVEAAELVDGLRRAFEERGEGAGPELDSVIEVGTGGLLLADADALRRALVNLLDNALKHAEAKRIVFEARCEDGELRLAIVDDGRGIEPVLRAHVFEPFRQGTDREQVPGGAGLGLAIVREIARGHGGSVSCEAGPDGAGCRVELRLPLEESEVG